MSIPVLVRSVGPEPSAGYYTQWTTFIPGYPKFKNQDTGVSQAFYAPDGVTLTAYRAHYLYFTGQTGEIVDRLVDFNVGLIPGVGEYYDIPVTSYQTGGTGLNPNPGSSSGTAQPSGPARLDITVSESFALSTGDLKVTPWHLPRFTQERAVSGAQWANLSAVQSEDYAAAASVPLAASMTTELLGQDFGFALPSGAQINGIEVEVTRKVQAGAVEKRQPMVSLTTGAFSVTSLMYGDDWFNLQTVAPNVGQGNIYVAYGNGVWIAATDRESTVAIYRSVDGRTWAEISHSSIATSARGVAFSNGVWMVTQYGGTATAGDQALRSTDNGLTWALVALGFGTSSNSFKSPPVSNGAGVWLVGGNNGAVSRSADNGVTWARIGYSAGASVSKILWTGTKFVLLTFGDVVANSTDGSSWTTRDYGATVMGSSSAWPVFMDGKVVYIDTSNGNIFYSSDHGDTWAVAAPPATDARYTSIPGFSVYYDELNGVYRWLGSYGPIWNVQLESDDFPPTTFRISEYPAVNSDWQAWNVALAPAVADKYGLSFEATHLLAPVPVSGQIFDEGRELVPSSAGGGWDLSSPTNTGVSFLVGGADTWLSGVGFTSDGSLMFVLLYDPPTNGLRVTKYSLSTPWNIATATLVQTALLTSDYAPLVGGIQLSDDGTKLYCTGIGVAGSENGLGKVLQFNLGVAYDLSSASLDGYYPDTGFTLSLSGDPFAISDSGTRFFTTSKSFALSTPWDITTRVAVESGVNLGPFPGSPANLVGMAIKNDGTRVVVAFTDGPIHKVDLETPWMLTSRVTPTVNYSVAGDLPAGDKLYGIFMRADGEQLYTATTDNTVGDNSRVNKYTFGTPEVVFAYDTAELFEGRNDAGLEAWDVGRFGGPDLRGADAGVQSGMRTWTAAEVNDPAFGVGYFARGLDGVLEVAYVRARIHYRADPTTDTLPAKRSNGLAGVAESPSGVKVAVGVDGKILRKPANSPTWASVSSGTTVSLNAVEWVGDRFVAVGMFGMALDGGADGSAWTRIDTGAVSSLWAIKRVPNTLRAVAVGNDDYSFERGRNGGWTT
jgi:hypothetical protein